ncbi:MAG: hypothetical protein AB1742_06080 [bacterium]
MIEVSSVELAEHLDELLTIKYADPAGSAVVRRLLRNKDRKRVAIIIDDKAPIVLSLSADGHSVSVGDAAGCDAVMRVSLVDLVSLMVGALPIRSVLTRRLKYRGSLIDGFLIKRLFTMEIGDRPTAMAYFRHYFLDE